MKALKVIFARIPHSRQIAAIVTLEIPLRRYA
jgi:hypothetical protein